MSESVKDKIKGAQRQRRVYRMNLRGDLVEQIQRLEAELEETRDAQRESGYMPRLAGAQAGAESPEVVALANRVKSLQDEMADWWLELTLEAQPWAEWRDFKVTNPAQEDVREDQTVGFHFDAILESGFARKCVAEPDLDDEDWEGIFEKCSSADLNNLALDIYTMHERELNIPKSLTASGVLRRIAAASKLPEPGESPSDDSTAGSQLSGTSTGMQTESPAEPLTPTSSSSPVSQSGPTSTGAGPKP